MSSQSTQRASAFTLSEQATRRRDFAQRLHLQRQTRIQYFGLAISEEVPWDILMVLYASRDAIKIASVQADVGGAATTSLRWIRRLENDGYICRHKHPRDQRIVRVGLTTGASEMIDRYFDEALSRAALEREDRPKRHDHE